MHYHSPFSILFIAPSARNGFFNTIAFLDSFSRVFSI